MLSPPPHPPPWDSHGGVPRRPWGSPSLTFGCRDFKVEQVSESRCGEAFSVVSQRAPLGAHTATAWEAPSGEEDAEHTFESVPEPSGGQKSAVPANLAGYVPGAAPWPGASAHCQSQVEAWETGWRAHRVPGLCVVWGPGSWPLPLGLQRHPEHSAGAPSASVNSGAWVE